MDGCPKADSRTTRYRSDTAEKLQKVGEHSTNLLAVALPAQTRRRWWWAAAMPHLWALGWMVTTLARIPVEEQVTIFGATGAVTFSALSGLLLYGLLLPRPTTPAGAARVEPSVVSKV